jgi:Carboxylesterase family
MLKAYIDDTILPNVIEQFRFPVAARKQVKETISWRFFDQLPPDPPYLINAMQKLLTETKSVYPFYQTIELIANPPAGLANDTAPAEPTNSSKAGPFYVYVFQHSNSMDLRGKINYFGGASHSSELPFLFGPSLFQQIARRRLSQNEDKLSKKFRSLIVEFIKTSNPTPGRLFDTWHPYTADQKYVKMIGSRLDKHTSAETSVDSTFEDNLQRIEQMLIPVTEEIQIVTSAINPYNLSPRDQLQEAATRTGKNAFYIDEAKNSEYYYYMRRVYGFWNDFLPKLAKMERRFTDGVDEADPIGFTEQDTQKYKHAFFSMLTLVCLLLAILGVCVYILKRNTDSELSGGGNFL